MLVRCRVRRLWLVPGTVLTLLVLILLGACGTSRPTATPLPATGTPSPTAVPTPQPAGDGVVDGWAVLAEKDFYADVGKTDLPVDYINLTRLRQRLSNLGWQQDHVRELREFDRQDLREGLAWLADSADADDVVLLYVAAHGSYLREDLGWSDFFPADWAALPGGQRVLIVDACTAAEFTAAVQDDPRPHLSIAAVDADEYGWTGLEEEGLPIIGSVFTYYFVAAFDEDGLVSVQEAALMAQEQQRTYFHQVVLAVPEFLEMYHGTGDFPEQDPDYPHVIVHDAIGAPLHLALDARNPAGTQRGDLIRADVTDTFSPDQIKQILALADLSVPFQTTYTAQVVRLVYQTVDPHGNPVQASGAILLPVGVENPPVLSLQHGTETKRDAVPSLNVIGSAEGLAGLLLASQGYLVCIPDYLGLGESDMLHPYMHAKSLATAVVDMLRAARAYGRENGVSLGEQLFLAGYSEGGFATLAAHKEIEQHHGDEFRVTAVAPMAGLYDLSGTVPALFRQPTYDWPAYIAYFFTAYDQIYGWNRLDEIFVAPYGDRMPDLFDGTHAFFKINDQLPVAIDQLLDPDFVANALAGQEPDLNTALEQNALLNWTPSAPIRFCHGDADQVAPYQNALTALDRLKENGAEQVELTTIEGGTHESAGLPCVLDMMVWFNEFR